MQANGTDNPLNKTISVSSFFFEVCQFLQKYTDTPCKCAQYQTELWKNADRVYIVQYRSTEVCVIIYEQPVSNCLAIKGVLLNKTFVCKRKQAQSTLIRKVYIK